VTGFDNNGFFEIGRLQSTKTGRFVILRDEYGRPGWTGRGRDNGG
jgi:hypothetical protein